MSSRPRRIAIVRLSALGDVVHALPVASALRARWPESRITWIVERRHGAILRDHPALDEVVTVDTRAWRTARRPGAVVAAATAILDVRRRLREASVDVTVNLQGLVKSGLVTWATAAPLRIGFTAAHCREPIAAVFTNRRVAPPPGARHVVDQYLSLLAALAIEPPERVEFPLPSDAAAETAIEDFFATRGIKPRDRVVVLNVGAARPSKRWPASRFVELARRLPPETGARVVVLWGPDEAGTARAIAESVPGATLAPPTDLFALVAVVRRASVVVAGDTGPIHLAAGLGVPCVGLFGPTSGIRNGPYGPGHRIVQSPDGTMASIAVDPVHDAVVERMDAR